MVAGGWPNLPASDGNVDDGGVKRLVLTAPADRLFSRLAKL